MKRRGRDGCLAWILQGLSEGLTFGGIIAIGVLVGSLIGFAISGCRTPGPQPSPSNPGGTGGSVVSGTGGNPPIVNPEPGPVPAGDPDQCDTACTHAANVCRGSRAACDRACARAGGADPELIPCVMAADGCPALRLCDPLTRAAQ